MTRVASATPGPAAVAQPHQAAGTPRHQRKFLGQLRGALRGGEGRLALAAELVTHASIVQRMAESIGMIERLSERNSLLGGRSRVQRVAG